MLLFALAGCGTSSRDAHGRRHTLIVAVGADEYGLSLNRDRLGRYPLNANLCDPLVRLAADFTVAPALAAHWSAQPGNTVRFVLRPAVTFSDGTPLDTRAVSYTLGLIARAHSDFSGLTDSSVHVVDDSTVDITPGRVNRRLPEQLVHPTYALLAPGSDPTRRPVCTGPFRLGEYLARDRLTVVRNARFRGTPARLDSLIFRFIPDEATRLLALRSGEVDLIVDDRRSSATALARVPGLRVVTAPTGAVVVLFMNLNGAAPYQQLRNLAVRRAVAQAIDRHALVEHVLGGRDRASAVSTVNPPSVLGSHAALVHGVPHDSSAAVRALGPRRRTMTLIANPSAVDRGTMEFVQAQLASVGIDAHVESLDAAAYEQRLNSGAFDLDLETPSQNDANPAFLLALRWYSRSGTRSVAFTPPAGVGTR